MRRNRVWTTVAMALWLVVQMVGVSRARADEPEGVVEIASGTVSVLATVIALPLKLVTCVTTVAMSAAGYGLTLGSSEFVQDELVGGVPYACGGKYYVAPQEVGQYAEQPEQPR